MKRIVGIDFGLKRIGLAISDPSQKIAFPLQVVEGGKKGVENIEKILKPRLKEVEKIVIGNPLLMSGEMSAMSEQVSLFAKKLSEALSIPVELYDERLTSRQAENALRELSFSRKERTERLDTASAAILLQTYLDKTNK